MNSRAPNRALAALALAITSVACARSQAVFVPPAPPEVAVTAAVQRDVPVSSEWISTLDGSINAQIRPQVTGYLVKRLYREGAIVRKGNVLFEIDPRPFEVALAHARAQPAQAEAQLGKTELDIQRDTPLAKEHAIALSQLDNDVQANLSAKAAVQSAKAGVELVAANADIGVAKAAYFPQISLTGSGGFQSAAMASLFAGPAGFFAAGAALVQPLFTAGRLRSTVALTEAVRDEAVLRYRQTIQQSLRDVSDSLVAYRKAREFREQKELLTRSARDAQRLSDVRYQGGTTSYLEVLDSGTRLFAAELGLAQARLNELLTVVQTYRALGGGWVRRT
jgi:outer membrane protein TolC